ncbi:hypothetical protein AYO21_02252 [Fonsecaea monophora]|uniref:Uncharacterized protein n=1 Tax=Fonsecaea monophora TaxID=254056 RepID=A0A177FIX2_9EURO|nr:hypothetical protein AYO21_02252 [Fonsecaea monophora]OAG43666.1 hypothetical protein AYO21_02252 [Fonsecaea monophora]
MLKFKDKLFKRSGAPQPVGDEGSRSSSPSRAPTVPFPDGVKVLHDGSDATVDVCFVHGLTGNRDTTWTAKGQSQPWPQTLLAPQLTTARILTYGYDAYVVRTSVPGFNGLLDHASNLLHDLTADRARHNASDRPLIFVAHSLGGLVCKKAILLSRNNPEDHLKEMFKCTKGIIFMGTPHMGSRMADWARVPASALGMVKSTNKSLLKILELDDQLLESVQVEFLAMIRDLRESNRRLEVTCFFEELPFPVVGKVVSKKSATFAGYNPIGIHANHRNMVRFASSDETGFKRVLGELTRWEMELRSSTQNEPSSAQSDEPVHPSSRKPVFAVPFEPDPHFIPRESISSSIKDQLTQHRRAVLHGMGGTGKSQIAITYAYQYHQEHPRSHVFWMYAATRSRFIQACQQMARQLNLPGCEDPKMDACALVAGWLIDEGNGPWLLIVDNADDANLLLGAIPSGESDPDEDTAIKPLIDYLPRTLDPSRRILITTRNKDVADSLGQSATPIAVGPFSLPEAKLLLEQKMTTATAWPSDETVEELLTSLARVPLAITQAAAFINRNVMSIADYLRVFRTSESERMRQLSIELQDPRRERGFPNSVFRTWRLSFDQMRQRDGAAATLLAFLAFLDGQSIPLALVQRTQTVEADWRHVLGTITGYSLVVAAADETISMHPLVQESVRYWLEQHKEKESSVEQAVQVLAASFPSGEYSNWAVCQTLLPHAQAALRHQGGTVLTSEHRGQLQYHISWFLWASGRYEAAFEHVSQSYEIRAALLGSGAEATLDSLGLMALVLRHRGKYEEAEEIYRRELAGSEKALGVDHPDTLTSVNNLALVLRSRGKYEEAEEMYRRALVGMEKALGVDHPSTLTSINNLGSVLQSRGKYEEAEAIHRRVLAGREKALGVDHPDTLTSVYNLAYLLDAKQDLQQALGLYQRAVSGYERVLGADHPTTSACRERLSSLLRRME